MDTNKTMGQALQGDDENARREAARMMGSARTERKIAAARENGKKNVFTEETRVKLIAAQQARREREKAQRLATGAGQVETVKPPRGRPKKQPEATEGQE